jgi:hypothetical protein
MLWTKLYGNSIIIVKNNYFELVVGKTPASTVSLLGDFIRNVYDQRVAKRIKQDGELILYYLTKNEQNIGIESFE